jgi:hypothetical protein
VGAREFGQALGPKSCRIACSCSRKRDMPHSACRQRCDSSRDACPLPRFLKRAPPAAREPGRCGTDRPARVMLVVTTARVAIVAHRGISSLAGTNNAAGAEASPREAGPHDICTRGRSPPIVFPAYFRVSYQRRSIARRGRAHGAGLLRQRGRVAILVRCRVSCYVNKPSDNGQGP